MLNLTSKRESVKNYRKGIRTFNGYIANCAQLYAFIKDIFLLRIERKLRRGVLTLMKLFDYRGHIHLSESSHNLQTVVIMIGVISKRVMTEGMHNDRLIVLPEGQHPEVL